MAPNTAPAIQPASWFTRGFLALAALWLVAQGHRGSFLSSWRDEASLPGNVCWLLILYCLARLLIDWRARGLWRWPFSRDALFLLACLAVVELAWRLLAGDMMALMAFSVQPVMVLLGLGALHRRAQRDAPIVR